MLQAREIEQRFSEIQTAISEATRVCQSDRDTSPELRECIDKLDRQSSQARQALQSHDEGKIRQAIDDMEMVGDQAKRVCGWDSHATARVKEAVMKVHEELSDLKHQLH